MDIKTRLDAMLSRKFLLTILGIIVVTLYGQDANIPEQWVITLDTILPVVYMVSNALGDKWKKAT